MMYHFSNLLYSIVIVHITLIFAPIQPVKIMENLSITRNASTYFDLRLIGPPVMIVIDQFDQVPAKYENFSMHYFIHQSGAVEQLVDEKYRAWNIPNSYWHDWYFTDDLSIAIGLENGNNSAEMTSALISLVLDIKARHSVILNTAIISGYDVAIDRENRTIPNIPWAEMARAGLGIMPQEEYNQVEQIPSDVDDMISNAYLYLKEIGYYVSSNEISFKDAIKAFQAHFLPDDHGSRSFDNKTYTILQQVRDLYVGEYAKQWQLRIRNLNYISDLSINSSFPSPNIDKRLFGPPFIIVIHDTEENFEDSLQTLTNPNTDNPVSVHYLINLEGSIYQLVNESDRAWQAGVSYWHGFKDLNDVSIGIELVNTNSSVFGYPNKQITALIDLLDDIRNRYNIPLHFIVSHEDIAAPRRSDPGPHFPWYRLVESGLSIDAPVENPNMTNANMSHSEYVVNIRRMLKEIGYLIEPQWPLTTTEELQDCFRRFQWRFAPDYSNWTLSEVYIAPYEKLVAVRDAYVNSYTFTVTSDSRNIKICVKSMLLLSSIVFSFRFA